MAVDLVVLGGAIWVDAVNAERSFGQWRYAIAKKTTDVPETITAQANEFAAKAPMN